MVISPPAAARFRGDTLFTVREGNSSMEELELEQDKMFMDNSIAITFFKQMNFVFIKSVL